MCRRKERSGARSGQCRGGILTANMWTPTGAVYIKECNQYHETCALAQLSVGRNKALKPYSNDNRLRLVRLKSTEAFRPAAGPPTSVARRTHRRRTDSEVDERVCSQRVVGPTSQWPRPETVWPKGSERAAARACCRLMLCGASGWRLSPKKDGSLLHSSETVAGPRAA